MTDQRIHADIFADVCDMNNAFGNAKGDPHAINGKKLFNQCKNLGDEFTELMNAFGWSCEIALRPYLQVEIEAMPLNKRPPQGDAQIVAIRDALCDINVFSLGGHHFMGYDARVDMRAVYESNMSKFVKDEEDEWRTKNKFDKENVSYTIEGEYPRKIFRSDRDQPDMPKGKFLKSASTFKPVFVMAEKPPTAGDVIEQLDAIVEMVRERAARKAEFERRMLTLNNETAKFRAQLELKLFGMPAFDGNANQEPGQVDEAGLRAIHDACDPDRPLCGDYDCGINKKCDCVLDETTGKYVLKKV